jgi:hypothetical protein
LRKSWSKFYRLPNFFFSLENQKIFEYNFNTATHGGHKKHIFFNRVAQLLASKGSKSTFWAISPVFSVAISLNYFLVPPWVISNFCYYWCTVVRWREIYVFFENDLFDPEIGYYTPKISLEKCFSRLSSTQWSIFTIHSGPLGGNSYYSVENFFVSAQNRHILPYSKKSQRPYAMLKAPVPSITVVKQH